MCFRDGSFEYPQHMFRLRNKIIIFSYALLSGGLIPAPISKNYSKNHLPHGKDAIPQDMLGQIHTCNRNSPRELLRIFDEICDFSMLTCHVIA